MKLVKVVSTVPIEGKNNFNVGDSLTNLIEMKQRSIQKEWNQSTIIRTETTASNGIWAVTITFEVLGKKDL